MSNNFGNKETMARNIRYFMDKNGVTSTEICEVIGVPQSTFSYWLHARTYPRIDKIEKMASFFGITKADLVEEFKKPAVPTEKELLVQAIVEHVSKLTPDQIRQVIQYAQFLAQNQAGV